MVRNIKKSHSPSVVPGVVITETEEPCRSKEPSRDKHSRSVSISRLKINDPLRKEMMFVREKSPFEIGENRNVQLASSKAIIDKALIMDVSGGVSRVDEYVSLFFSSGCVIDEAACKDISIDQNIEVVVIEQELEPETVIKPVELSTVSTVEVDVQINKHSEQVPDLIVDKNLEQLIDEKTLPVEGEIEAQEISTTLNENNIDVNEKLDPIISTEETETNAATELSNANEKLNIEVEKANDNIVESVTEEETNGETEDYYSTESSSEESYEELVDPSLWKAYNSDDEDATAWFYKKPEEMTKPLTEKEKDEEFRKERLAKRCPVFLTKLTDRSGPVGSVIKLQSSVSGLEATVRWLKDDQLVERTSKLQTTAFDGLYSLILKDVQKNDSGIYTIIAKNRGGEVSCSAKVNVFDDASRHVDIPTIIKIRDYYHHALNDLIIECQVMFCPDWLVPDVMWLKGEDPVSLDNRIRASFEGNEMFQLNIYNPTPDDSGIYTCIVRNSAGERRITHEVEFTCKVPYLHLPGMHHADKKILTPEESKTTTHDQDQSSSRGTRSQKTEPEPYKEESYVIRDSKNKLTWAGQLTNITTQKGRTVKMICSVNGEQPILKWQKNLKPIDYGDRIKLLNNGVVAQILIKDVRASDAGEYTCTAKNNYNEISTTCVLKVIELATAGPSPPTFTKAIKEFYDLRVEDLVLETQVHGVPNPEIQWFKDGSIISYDDKCMLNREPNGKYQLRIHKPQAEDCGLYECRAKNTDGNAQVKHEVKFITNQQFVYAHRIEHADRFKRQHEEDLTSVSATQLPNVEDAIPDNKTSELAVADTSVEKESEVIETNDSNAESKKEKPVELDKAKQVPKKRTMPRRRFDEGPSEPFIIRDSKKKLTWETKLKNITSQEGKTIKLVCIVVGPQPQYKWMKNGKPLVWSKTVVNACKSEFGSIIIKNVNLSDAGEYTAQCKNPDSEIECSCNVTIFEASKEVQTVPTFTRVADYYDIRVDDLVLEVQVRGLPHPTLTWERDGREMKNGMDRIIIAREKDDVYRLCIHNPEKLDGGNWVIKAKNAAGEEKVKHQVIFKGKDHYQYLPGIFHAESKPTHDERDDLHRYDGTRAFSRATSIFSVASFHQEPSVPVAEEKMIETITETLTEQVVTDTEQLQPTETVSKKPQKREWRKKLSALYSSELAPTATEAVKPKALEFHKKLFFETQLKNLTAAEGTPVKLVCSCVGPSPTIKWYKNNIPLVWSKTVKNETKLGVGAILIVSSSVNDNGIYKCVASNSFGEIETSCKLTVYELQQNQYEPPKFTRNVKEYYNVQVNDLLLEVHVRGYPSPTIKWFRDGVMLTELEGDKFFLLREPDGVHKLTIHDPQRMDEGRYVCEAENIAGKDTIKHVVTKLNKEEYCHVHGILYHDQIMVKRPAEEKKIETFIDRGEPREFVWMEDGSYYIRGQTPEHLWEWETDTSAESEYEPLASGAEDAAGDEAEDEDEDEDEDENEDEAEGKPKDETEDKPGDKIEDKIEDDEKKDIDVSDKANDDINDNDTDEIDSTVDDRKPVPAKKRGAKIKKLRKKVYRPKAKIEAVNIHPEPKLGIEAIVENSHIQNVPIEPDSNVEKSKKDEDLGLESPTVDTQPEIKDAETQRKERYLRLFPEFVPDEPRKIENKNPLKFNIELRDLRVSEGKSAKLFCTVTGAKPDIKWQKNGAPLEFSRNVKNQSHDSTGIVNILKVSKQDEGIYKVIVKNKDSMISNEAKLTIVEKTELPAGSEPRFITGISQHYDFRVDDLILEIHIKGDGLLLVQWFLDGIALENNDKYIQIREPMGVYKLCIHNPQIRDNGNYMIQVRNDFGSAELRYYLRFEGKTSIPSYGIFHADPRRQYVDTDVKEKPRVHREVIFLEDGSYYVRGQTPEKYWEWETDTSAESEYEPYVHGDTPTPDKSEEEKTDTDEEDKPEKTEEPIDKDTFSEKSDTEHGDEPDETEQPEISQKVEQIVKRGPKIKKMRKKRVKLPDQGEEVVESLATPDFKPQTATGDSPTVSKVEQVVIEPETHPKIKLSQRIASGKSEQIEPAPKPKRKPIEVEFISRLRNQTLLKGKTVCLNCCCSDNQKIEVAWFKDGKKFEMNKRCVSDIHFGFITLEIYRTTVEDSGCYECHVKTANGEAKDSCIITVFELPDKREVELVPPTFIHPIKETYHPTTNDLHLETRVRGNPVPTISWNCDAVLIDHNTDKFEIFNQHYYELGTRITTATLIINNPQLKDSGKYTLVATNDVQTSQISRQVNIGLRPIDHRKKRMDDVVIENEAPRIIPKLPTPEPEVPVQEDAVQNPSEVPDSENVELTEQEPEEDDDEDDDE